MLSAPRREETVVVVDNLTHAFAGAVTAHALSPRAPAPVTVAAAVVAANLADLDWLSVAVSLPAFFEVHRGITHALVAVPVVGLVVAAAARVVHGGRPGFVPLAAVCTGAAATHPCLDALNAYGVRPFLPFRATWHYADLLAIVDPWLWLVLGGTALLVTRRTIATTRLWAVVGSVVVVAALNAIPRTGRFGVLAGLVWVAAAAALLAWWLRGVRQRRGIAAAGIVVAAAYIGGVAVLHRVAEEGAAQRGNALATSARERVLRVAALPMIGDLVTWRGLVETDRSIYRFPVVLAGVGPADVEHFATLETAAPGWVPREAAPRAFLSFARFVAATVREQDGRRTLMLADPRFDSARAGDASGWPVQVALDGR